MQADRLPAMWRRNWCISDSKVHGGQHGDIVNKAHTCTAQSLPLAFNTIDAYFTVKMKFGVHYLITTQKKTSIHNINNVVYQYPSIHYIGMVPPVSHEDSDQLRLYIMFSMPTVLTMTMTMKYVYYHRFTYIQNTGCKISIHWKWTSNIILSLVVSMVKGHETEAYGPQFLL